jgi:hypothetical protein
MPSHICIIFASQWGKNHFKRVLSNLVVPANFSLHLLNQPVGGQTAFYKSGKSPKKCVGKWGHHNCCPPHPHSFGPHRLMALLSMHFVDGLVKWLTLVSWPLMLLPPHWLGPFPSSLSSSWHILLPLPFFGASRIN